MDAEPYFDRIREKTDEAFDIAEEARSQNKDPEPRVDIPVAEDLPEKASSLVIAAKFPELEDQGVADRIRELEEEYGKNDERVAFEIAREIAEGDFYEFDELERACNAGIRVGVSYMTGGITTAPLEGIGDIRIKENNDGSDYLAVYYSGPIRSAGGTASAMSVLLSDYVRKSVDLAEFKPSETIIKRYATEVDDYYNRVTAKQYYPEREETSFIAEHVPIEVTGGPTRDLEVTNHKDLERVETNQIRGGMCLVYLDGLPLKAPKIKKRIEKWGKEFGLEHWEWIKEYLELQEEIHSSDSDDDEQDEEDSEEPDYTPSDKFLGSMTAGRPVFSHPGRKGGFRLRYGHTRTNGLAATSFHPATMEVTERFIATGTQLKTEYPMKGTVGTPSDAAHPPVVRLDSGEVMRLTSREKARELEDEVDEILFLGDMLVPYGEFVENGKDLLPSPYVEEWWEKELQETLEEKDMKLGKEFSDRRPTPEESKKISVATGVPFHPRWTHHWREADPDNFRALYRALSDGSIKAGGDAKECLEQILAQHRVDDGGVRIHEEELKAINILLKPEEDNEDLLDDIEASEDIPDFIREVSGIEVRDQSPHYVGARMGRPEKAERRTIKGKPQLLFPCGKQEGGRMRNLVASYNKGEVDEQILHNYCPECDNYSYFSYCTECGSETEPRYFCSDCGHAHEEEVETCEKCGGERFNRYKRDRIDVESLVDDAMENVGMNKLPELLKSVRGMSAKHKHVEPIEKGLLRQKHDLYVNKDGTVRYDATDLPMSHFKPEEIGVDPERLRELGYSRDVHGEPLEREDQVLEMKPQDIVIPDGDKSLAASDYFVRVANFVDDLLEDLYGLGSFYDVDEKEDLVGELVIGLAPHTSGGTVGRIIGFTDAKGIYSHPYWHAAKRRNCLPGDTEVKLADGSSRSLRDLFESANNSEKADGTGTVEKVLDEEVVSVEDGSVVSKNACKVVRAPAQDFKIELGTSGGRELEVFPDHRVKTADGVKKAREIEKGDRLISPADIDVDTQDVERIDLLDYVSGDHVCLRGVSDELEELIEAAGGLKPAAEKLNMSKKTLYNYKSRDSVPLTVLEELEKETGESFSAEECLVASKRDTVEVPRFIKADSSMMKLIGYYLAEGHHRRSTKDGEEFYQVAFSYGEEDLRENIHELVDDVFGLDPSDSGNKLVVSSRIVQKLFGSLALGSGAHSKRVPDFFSGLPKEKVAEMLSAYFAGDGSVEKGRLHVQATSASRELLQDIDTQLKRFGIYTRYETQVREAGGILVEKYGEKYEGEEFTSHKLHVRSSNAVRFGREIGFDLERKQRALESDFDRERAPREERQEEIVLEEVKNVETRKAEERFMYDLEVEDTHNFVTSDNLVTNNCDGDEDAILLLMDGLLNFSRQFLPDITGARTMDAPLILSTVLNPDEIDDEAWAVETVEEYPLEFYRETQSYKPPWELETDIEIGEDIVYGDEPFDHMYTHDSSDVENGPTQSEYVTLDEMSDKTGSQLELGRKIKAVDANATAELLLKKHFIPDIKGNLRSFSSQEMRCVDCNEKFRRVPLRSQTIAPTGKTTAECPECGGKVLLTISEGTIKKYMRPSEDIIDEYEISPYVRQQILILKQTLQSLFGKEQRQSGLKQFT